MAAAEDPRVESVCALVSAVAISGGGMQEAISALLRPAMSYDRKVFEAALECCATRAALEPDPWERAGQLLRHAMDTGLFRPRPHLG